MATRKIIEIDRDLCDGCGACTTACDEGALELDDENKAVLVREIFCDGMGMCLDVCPTGALTITEREVPEYDVEATRDHVRATRGESAVAAVHSGAGEPAGSGAEGVAGTGGAAGEAAARVQSELSQWPIQLHLITPQAPYFQESDLLVAADCTAFALGNFHRELLRDHKLVIACPKLDDTQSYVEKLAELIRVNNLRSLTVAVMTVPCCRGLMRIVEMAVEASGVSIPIQKVVVGIDGQIAE